MYMEISMFYRYVQPPDLKRSVMVQGEQNSHAFTVI